MRLTSSNEGLRQTPVSPRSSRLWALPVIAVGSLAIFALDRATDAAPVQHLYYLPIVLAARYFGQRGGLTVAGHGCVVHGDKLIHRGAPQSGIEERL